MENNNKDAFSEVIEILKLIDDEKKLEALPMEMLEVLKVNSNPEYKPQISKEIPLDEQNLKPETLSILTWIAKKYWNEELVETELNITNNAENVQEIKEEEKIENNEEETQNEEIEAKESIEQSTVGENSNMPILYKDLKWYEKIRIKIVEFFNKIFRINKTNKEQQN